MSVLQEVSFHSNTKPRKLQYMKCIHTYTRTHVLYTHVIYNVHTLMIHMKMYCAGDTFSPTGREAMKPT